MGTDFSITQDDDGKFWLTPDPMEETDHRIAALFEERGLQGGGYTMEGLVTALVQMKMPEALSRLNIWAEADNISIICRDRGVLERVAALLQAACTDHELLVAAIEHAGKDLE